MSRLLERSRSSSIQSATKTTKLVRDFKWCKSFRVFAFSPFLTGFTAKVSLSWAKNELTRILPFFQKCDEILFSSVFLLFSSRCAFFDKRDQKKRRIWVKKKFCFVLWHFLHTKEKRKKKFITLRRKKRFLRKRFKRLLLLERTLRALESKELFSFSIVVLLYSKQ